MNNTLNSIAAIRSAIANGTVTATDLAQEQLLGNVFETLSFSKGRLRFVCNLTVNDLMDPSWIKVYHLMESVYPRRVQCFARVILTAYTDI